MPDIASVMKSEISRIARKELRAEISPLKKAVVAQRGEIAALNRRAQELERELRRMIKTAGKMAAAASDEVPTKASNRRFSAKGFASARARLGLSAAECGLLVGASGQSIYNWEQGSAKPRAKHLAAIAALRTMGKKEARKQLDAANTGKSEESRA